MTGRGCFKFGCFGCLGCVALVLLVVGVVALFAIADQRAPEEFREETSTQALPAPGLVPGEADASREFRPGGTVGSLPAAPGRVELDFSMGNLYVEPVPAGEPIRVEANFDTNRYTFEHGYREDPGGGWTYRLEFGRKSRFFTQFRSDPSRNSVRLYLPKGTPFALDANLGVGETHLELGGLWLTEAIVDAGIGEHSIRFDEPTPEPIGRFRLDSSIGETRVISLGNASPESVEVNHSIGEVNVDLAGAWRRDAEVSARLSIGAIRIELPDESVGVKLRRISVALGEATHSALRDRAEPPAGAPTITLDVSGSLGEVRLDR